VRVYELYLCGSCVVSVVRDFSFFRVHAHSWCVLRRLLCRCLCVVELLSAVWTCWCFAGRISVLCRVGVHVFAFRIVLLLFHVGFSVVYRDSNCVFSFADRRPGRCGRGWRDFLSLVSH
jgi:hypothetical protein